jgi:LDH2 family malate/lactate/ureidoglycolate dehydrogenase
MMPTNANENTIPTNPAITAWPIERPKPKIKAAIEIPKIETFDAAQGQNWSFGLP